MLHSCSNYYWINYLTGSCGWVDGWEREIQRQKGSQGTAEITAVAAVERILGSIRELWGCQDSSRVGDILRFSGWVLRKSHSYWDTEGWRDPLSVSFVPSLATDVAQRGSVWLPLQQGGHSSLLTVKIINFIHYVVLLCSRAGFGC